METSSSISWFESDDDKENVEENVEEITIEIEEGGDLPESVVAPNKVPLDSSLEKSGHVVPEMNLLDPQVEALLGKEGLSEDKDENLFHPSFANKWAFILEKGLSEETNLYLVSKYSPPSNCLAVAPPVLNPEIKTNMKKEAVARDDKQQITRRQLSTSLSAIDKALTKLLNASALTRDEILPLIELLSDAGRLLTAVHFKNTTHRRFLVLGMGFKQKIKNNIKDVLFNAPIDGYVFGKDLSENLNKAKALERNSLSIWDPSHKFQPKLQPNLNGKGLSQPQRMNRAVQRRRDGPTSCSYYQQPPSHQPARSPQFKVPRTLTGRQQ